MSNADLTDRQAKSVLRQWPECPTKLFRTPKTVGYWLRAQPPDGNNAGPTLVSPGAELFGTQPDGLWLWFEPKLSYVDVIAVEVCRKDQNLNDKRSRYMPTNHALLARCSSAWLTAAITRQNSGKKRRWEAGGTIKNKPSFDGDIDIPVRHLRVLYALPDHLYDRWLSNVTTASYEFFCHHTSLRSHTNDGFRNFLTKMIPGVQYYTRPKMT